MLAWICRFPLPLCVWEGLRFLIVALPGLFDYPFVLWVVIRSRLYFIMSPLIFTDAAASPIRFISITEQSASTLILLDLNSVLVGYTFHCIPVASSINENCLLRSVPSLFCCTGPTTAEFGTSSVVIDDSRWLCYDVVDLIFLLISMGLFQIRCDQSHRQRM